jgi:hypothetical protein
MENVAKFIRLNNGDDIVAETVEIEDEDGIIYMVYNPLKVFYSHTSHTGYLAVSFMPWVFPKICEHQEFVIHAEDVLLVSNVSESMNEYYWNNLNTQDQKVEEKPEPEINEEEIESIIQNLTKNRTFH